MTTDNIQVHQSAIIDEGVEIGSGTRVWHWTHISSGAKLGEGCSLGQNVFVAPSVVVGKNVKIQNNVSLYDGVVVEDDVFCGPSMVFTNVYNPRSAVSRKGEYKKTLVKKGATLGANCTIVCGIEVGCYAFIGAGAVINKSVPDFALMLGVPAKPAGWMSRFGERIPIAYGESGTFVCPHTQDEYKVSENECELIG